MTSNADDPGRESDSPPTPEEERLAALLTEYQSMRDEDDSIGVGKLREKAGELFPELAEMAECLGVLKAGFDEEDAEGIPVEVGRYRVVRKIGLGVSGVVYEAEDPESGDRVAVKVMKDSLAFSGTAVERFRREIRAARNLEHPHIVRILDHGETRGRLFFVMDLVDGCSLGTLLDEIESKCGDVPDEGWLAVLDAHGIPPLEGPARSPGEAYGRRIAALFAPLARALAASVEAGLIHRDLKPDNILLTKDGRAMISDFGLAKVLGEDITSTMAVLGTPAYMSPEQAAGRSKKVDARSDIYGLGATLHHALSRARPLTASSFHELIAAILTQRPRSIRESCPDCPRGLSDLVDRCLEKEPADRYPDGQLLADDLERIAAGRPPFLGALPWPRRLRRTIAGHRALTTGAGAAVVLAAFVLFYLTRPAELRVASFPPGDVTVNGVTRASPWEDEIDTGETRITVTLERFRPVERTIDVGAGESKELLIDLWPVDRWDVEAQRQVAMAHGAEFSPPAEGPTAARGGIDLGDVTIVSPRGRVTIGRGAIYLGSAEAAEDLGLEIVDGAGETVHAEEIDLPAGGARFELPGTLEPGLPFRVRVARPDGVTAEAAFELTREDPVPAWMRVPEGRVLAIDSLLAAGRLSEAFTEASLLAGEEPDRPLPLRYALDALERSGLVQTGIYVEVFARHAALEEDR